MPDNKPVISEDLSNAMIQFGGMQYTSVCSLRIRIFTRAELVTELTPKKDPIQFTFHRVRSYILNNYHFAFTPLFLISSSIF